MRSFLKISLILALCSVAFADVAPDAGYTNVPADLVLETSADLSGYRFFLESPMNVEEVKLNAGSPTVIAASGRGGAARYAKLIAVPVSDMTISGDLSGGLLDDLIRRKRFPNARELLSHNFQATITLIEKPIWKPPVYRLSVENGSISASKFEAIPVVGGTDRSLLLYAIPVVIGGVLITLAIAVIGIWLFRRSRKKV
jgi:hypothetical protein